MISVLNRFVGFFVWIIGFNVFYNTTSSVTNSKHTCALPWKRNFGFTTNATDETGRFFDGLRTIITGFLYSHEEDESLKIHLDKCSKDINCKLSTVLDKNKKGVMFLCILVERSEVCYISNCSCQKKQGKREIQSIIFQHATKGVDRIGDRDIDDLRCELRKSTKQYLQYKTVSRFNQNVICTNGVTQSGFKEENTSVKEECLCKNRKNRDTNMGMNVLFFFGGALLGLFFGIGVTVAYFKRKSKKPRILSVRNMVYNRERTDDEEITFKEITEYSEITNNYSNIEEEETLLEGKRMKNACNQDRDGCINQHGKTHVVQSMTVKESLSSPSFVENSHPLQSAEALKREEYLEPTTHHYYTQCQVDSNLFKIEKKEDEGCAGGKENHHVNEKDCANLVGPRDENVDHYTILIENSTENREIFLPKETNHRSSNLCNVSDDYSEEEPPYYVLRTTQTNQPVYTNTCIASSDQEIIQT
ncbi:uncharacterized protein LOC134240343 [Saccostrea cucullata]|uniref:uncharacterized protein LOC134240343 n=1 Tax=Saccostrea cuccullata TaxID=36930 RepID=UPI002ED1B0FA